MKRTDVSELINELAYLNYKHNRQLDATMSSDWKLIYGADMVDEMEKRYQKERHANVHPVFREILQGVCDDP